MMLKALALLAVLGIAAIVEAKKQTITVKGTTICHKKRTPGVLVQLWEHDSLDPNDLLKETRSDSMGDWTLTGTEDEITTISPFIRITHECDAKPGCKRIADYDVPKDKVGGTYDMTYVPMNIKVQGESTKC